MSRFVHPTSVKTGGVQSLGGLRADGSVQGLAAEAVRPRGVWPETNVAFRLDGALTPEECAALARRAEGEGYERAMVNVGAGRQILDEQYRKSSRCIIDDEVLTDWLWQRIGPHVPVVGGRVPIGLNERLRFLKYDPGEFFMAHSDGSYWRPRDHHRAGDSSFLTVLIYLNEGYEGCWTRLYNAKGDDFLDVEPHTGMVLVHSHSIEHEATPLIKGCKLVIRTDIMFEDLPTASLTSVPLLPDGSCFAVHDLVQPQWVSACQASVAACSEAATATQDGAISRNAWKRIRRFLPAALDSGPDGLRSEIEIVRGQSPSRADPRTAHLLTVVIFLGDGAEVRVLDSEGNVAATQAGKRGLLLAIAGPRQWDIAVSSDSPTALALVLQATG